MIKILRKIFIFDACVNRPEIYIPNDIYLFMCIISGWVKTGARMKKKLKRVRVLCT